MTDKSRPYHLKPGERGTPYSVGEARGAANNHKMDAYHQDLIIWLCDEVEMLQEQAKELKSRSPVPIPKTELLKMRSGLLNSLFLSAFVKTFPNISSNKPSEADKLIKAEEIQLILLANGVPLDAASACEEWEKQVDEMVAKKASEMLLDKFGEGRNKIHDLLEDVERHLKDKMSEAGIPVREDW